MVPVYRSTCLHLVVKETGVCRRERENRRWLSETDKSPHIKTSFNDFWWLPTVTDKSLLQACAFWVAKHSGHHWWPGEWRGEAETPTGITRYSDKLVANQTHTNFHTETGQMGISGFHKQLWSSQKFSKREKKVTMCTCSSFAEVRRRRCRKTRVPTTSKICCMLITTPWHQWEPVLAEPGIYCQRQKHGNNTTHKHQQAAQSKTLETQHIWKHIFCSRIHRSARPLTFFFYLTASHSFFSPSFLLLHPFSFCGCLTAPDCFFHTQSTLASLCTGSHPLFFLLHFFSLSLLFPVFPVLSPLNRS